MPNSIDTWLASGMKVAIGGRELVMMPLPLSYIHRLLEGFQKGVLKSLGALDVQKGGNALMELIQGTLSNLDISGTCFELFSFPKHPGTKTPLNADISKEFFEDYLDTPTLRRIIQTFIKANELEETLKNLQSLPGVQAMVTALTVTLGQEYLNSVQASMALALGRSDDSLSPSLQDILPDTASEPPASGPGSTMESLPPVQ